MFIENTVVSFRVLSKGRLVFAFVLSMAVIRPCVVVKSLGKSYLTNFEFL